MRFDEHQSKFVAEFFVDHYDVMTGKKQSIRDHRKSDLEQELTDKFNDIFGTELTVQQIHDKIKNLKKAAKTKLQATTDQSVEETLRQAEVDSLSSVAIEIVADKIKSGSSGRSSFVSSDHRYLPNDHQDDQPLHTPSLHSSSMRYRLTNDAHSSNGPSAKRPRLTRESPPVLDGVGALQRSLILIQKQVAEKELRVLSAKEAAISKFSMAIDEFRRYVAEQRILSRGLSLGNAPVDIPPGLEGVLDQM